MQVNIQISEMDIIQRIIQGETILFELLIRRNNPYLYKVGRSYGFNHHDVEDLMQETFINAFLNLNKFESRSSFKTWVIKIMLNLCYHRKHKFSYKNEVVVNEYVNESSAPLFSNHHLTDLNRSIVNKELNQIIENAIAKIPLEYRMVFVLREISGLSIFETAQTMEISEANVKIRLNRAKNMLKREIEKLYSPDDIYEFNLVYCDKIVMSVMTELLKQLK